MVCTHSRRSRRQRFLSALTAVFLLAGLAGARAEGPEPAPEPGGLGMSLDGLLGKALDAADLLAPSGLGRLRVPGEVRILLVSSGADEATFGDGYAKQLTRSGDVDEIGLGTHAASVLFQVAPKAQVTAVDVYRKGRVHRPAVVDALHRAREHAKEFDAVVLAFPPAALLDPFSAGLAEGTRGSAATSVQPAGEADSVTAADPRAAERVAAGLADGWAKLREDAAELAKAGIAVVAPAGDLGPGPQAILGVAGLPEVITVGAADRDGVAAASAGGPSVFGRVKPDLVAPAGIAGLVPDESALAGLLALGGSAGPAPNLDLPVPAAGGRAALVGSTIPAAAAVAAVAAQLHRDGVGDGATLRGILTAGAVPLPGVPVWRQGAGRLAEAPRGEIARQRQLVAGAADLGAEPAAGQPWATEVKIRDAAPVPPVPPSGPSETGSAGGPYRALSATGRAQVRLSERITTGDRGGREAPPVSDDQARPTPAVTPTAEGLRLDLAPGDNPWAAGAWCGYLHIPLQGSDGIDLVEDVPLCLVEGLSLTAFNFYIHDMPAEDLTFALIPALPPGLGLLDGPLMVLPLNPLHEPLLAGVSGLDGLVRFPNVPPAYFVMRQFSDYGAPVVEDLPASGGGEAQRKQRDLGETSYLNYDALVLPNPCAERIQDHWPTGTPCHRAWLEERFGSGSVRYDRTTARYFVATPAGEMGIVFDFTKKSPGTGVTSRYVDLLTHDDLAHGSAISLEGLKPALDALGLQLSQAWTFESAAAAGDPEGTVATYKGLDAQHEPTSLVGAGTYPFALTTPNYKGTMRLNFEYTIDDALVAVVARVGKEVRTAVLSPQGSFQVDKVNLGDVMKQVPPFGIGTGRASFTFDLKPHGNAEGMLSFLVLPLNPLRPAAVHVKDRSFELTTWQRIDWPPAMMPRTSPTGGHGEVMGHQFQVDSNYSARQMNHPDCRHIDSGTAAADVCEGWQVMVHSPLDDAETFDVVDLADGKSFLAAVAAAGGELVNPHRATQGKREPLLAAGGLPLPVLIRSLVSDKLGVVVNGRFWEQLVIPSAALAAHPGPFEVRIEDNAKGRESTLLPHRDGSVTLAPYIAFNASHRRADTSLLREVPVTPPDAPAPPAGAKQSQGGPVGPVAGLQPTRPG
jgi:hypothetical protein